MKITLHTNIPITKYKLKNDRGVIFSVPVRDTVSFKATRKERNYETALTNIPRLPCACCGKIMIPENVFERPLVKNYDIPAAPVLKALKKYETQMHKPERDVFRRLEKLNKKFPELTLQELFNKKHYYHLANTEIKQLKVLSKIENTDFDISQESQEKLNTALQNTRKIMFLEGKKIQEKRRRMIREFIELQNSCPEKAEMQKIVSMIQELPSSRNDIDSFFIKYANLDSEALAFKLIESAKASIEHVKPTTENGADHTSNYIVLCRRCNNERSSSAYSDFIKRHPEMLKNSQKYIDRIIDYLNKKYMFGMESYPYMIQKQLFEETDGLINVDISKYRKPYETTGIKQFII